MPRVVTTKPMVYNEGMVNTMLRKTSTGLERQKIAVANINLLLAVSRKKKKDLAECMDKVPQALSKMLQNKQTWFFEDMCNAADFFGVGLETLLRTDLTPMKNLMMTKMMISLQQERSFFQVLRSQMMKIHQLHLQ